MKLKKFVSVALLALLLAGLIGNILTNVRASPTTITMFIIPTDDATIDKTQKDVNFGYQTDIAVLEGVNDARRAYLKYNISSLVDYVLVAAELRLLVYGYLTYTDDAGDTEIKRLSNTTWSEDTITWNNAPQNFGSLIAQRGLKMANRWVAVDVLSYINDAITDGNSSISFFLKAHDEIGGAGSGQRGYYYASKEGVGFPEIHITYEGTPPDATNPSFQDDFDCAVINSEVWENITFKDGNLTIVNSQLKMGINGGIRGLVTTNTVNLQNSAISVDLSSVTDGGCFYLQMSSRKKTLKGRRYNNINVKELQNQPINQVLEWWSEIHVA